MYELFRGEIGLQRITRPAHIEYHRVFDTIRETGAHHFLHGAAVDSWRGRLAVCFAFNHQKENSITERLLVRWSEDSGRTWSTPEAIAGSASCANSHSVFLSKEDGLWCFGPRFRGLGEPPKTRKGHGLIHFLDLRMEAWRYDGHTWQPMGIVAGGFWPLGQPTRMENGCWMIPGCSTSWLGAIAVSHGDDLLHWDVILPDTDGEVFTEAAAWTRGSELLMVMRNQSVRTDGKYHAAVAYSADFGKSFAPCEISNLPMATSKPFCGRLEDGRAFMVFNESVPGRPHDRSRMLLGIGGKDSFSLNRLYLVDEGSKDESGRRLALSYPYARQLGNRLYIAYSYESAPGMGANNNDAMLAVLDIDCLNEDN